jgi:hypothetical protein
MRLMHPRLPVIGPQLYLAGVQVDGGHLRRLGAGGRELARLHLLDLTVSLLAALLAQPFGNPLDVLGTDRQFSQPL